MKKQFCLLSLLFALVACAPSHPLGISDEQWNGMSFAQQQQAFTQQQQQDAIRQQQMQIAAQQQQQAQLNAQRVQLENNARARLGITDAEWARMTPDTQFKLRQEQEGIERQSQQAGVVTGGNAAVAGATQDIANAMRERNMQELYTNSAYGTVVDCMLSGGKAKFSEYSTTWAAFVPTNFSIAKGDGKNVGLRRNNKQKSSMSFWVSFDSGNQLQFCAGEGTGKSYKKCRLQPVSANFAAPLSIPGAVDGSTLSCRFAPGRR